MRMLHKILGKKRPREEAKLESSSEFGDSDQSFSLEENLTFSDTMVALQMRRAQFPRDDKGRRELLSLLNRRKHNEMMLAPLEKKRLRLSPLDMRFHLRDLLGSGHLKTAKTPSGLVIRVVKD